MARSSALNVLDDHPVAFGFRRGDWVTVRPLDEILATLDCEGKLDGLPFMPKLMDAPENQESDYE